MSVQMDDGHYMDLVHEDTLRKLDIRKARDEWIEEPYPKAFATSMMASIMDTLEIDANQFEPQDTREALVVIVAYLHVFALEARKQILASLGM